MDEPLAALDEARKAEIMPWLERLRDELHARGGTPVAVIEIHAQAGASDFHASTIGSVSTGHVAAGSLNQSLGPALVFELCKVM